MNHLTNSLWGLNQLHVHPAPPVIRIVMILFVLAIGLLGRYAAIEYPCQKIHYYLSIIFYGMVEVYL